ncbi:MAG: hypothetical protein JW791_00985 [Nanoarchaeota archaeon]|nr:hypothetical protein [Nanoarchaeota archaeon]
MRKASAITLSIFIMMIMLAVLLGYTAFYVDQVTVRPVVLMRDSEVSLKCFLVLNSIIGGEYVREGEPVDEGTLKSDLLQTYQLVNQQEFFMSDNQEEYEELLELVYGPSEIIVNNERVFMQILREGAPAACLVRLYGPVRTGFAGLYVTDEIIQAAYQKSAYWQCKLYGEAIVQGTVCYNGDLYLEGEV